MHRDFDNQDDERGDRQPPRVLLDGLIEGFQVVDRDWRYLYVNPAAVEHSRFSENDLIGRTMMEVYPSIEQTPLFSVLSRCMEERRAREMENRFEYPDGTSGWFNVRIGPVSEGLYILSMDITRRKLEEDTQQRTLEVLQRINAADCWRDLLESLLEPLQRWAGCEAVAIRLSNGGGDLGTFRAGFAEDYPDSPSTASEPPPVETYWNNDVARPAPGAEPAGVALLQQTCVRYGYRSLAVIPLRTATRTVGWIELFDGAEGRFGEETVQQLQSLADRVVESLVVRRAQDQVEHLNRVLLAVRSVNRTITTETDAQRMIGKVCALLVAARGYESAVIGLTEKADGRLIRHASAGDTLGGLEELLAAGRIPNSVRETMTVGGYRSHRNPAWNTSGREAGGGSLLIVSLDALGRSYGFLVIRMPEHLIEDEDEEGLLQEMAADVAYALHRREMAAEREESANALADAQEQLWQARKMEAVGRLAGGVAHDFNNILQAQLALCGLIKAAIPADEPLADDLAQITACTEMGTELVKQLLAFSRKQPLQLEVLDPGAIVAGMENFLRRLIGETVELRLDIDAGAGHVEIDRSQLELVIMNLALNARDAMPGGGTLRIRTGAVELGQEELERPEEQRPGRYVVLEVMDDGQGMDEKTQRRLFEPFFTTKSRGQGTGLGLSTVFGTVAQLGGSIAVESAPGAGTVFRILLPQVAAPPVVAPEPTPPRERIVGNGEPVLLVEDEELLRVLFQKVIERQGYDARTAGDGEEALRLIQGGEWKPQLVITDMVMPGMSGRVLADRLADLLPDTKVLFISGYTQESAESPDHYLSKPFTSEQLEDKIREMFDR